MNRVTSHSTTVGHVMSLRAEAIVIVRPIIVWS